MRNKNWKTDKPTGVLLALIRKALWGVEFAWTEEIDWEKVFSLALKHGVAAVVYETVKALPKGQRPPFEILLRWDVTTEMVRQGYRKRHAALLHLRDILAPKGIKIVVLKGESLAINYPDPECRECGDWYRI